MARFPNRTFGVEIECGHPGGSTFVGTSLVFDEVVEFQSRYEYDYDEELYYDPETGEYVDPDEEPPYAWTLGSDGSGVELRTPPLQGEKGLAELHKVMDYLTSIGAYVTDADGMHVHFGADDFRSWEMLNRLVTSWRSNLDIIEQMVGPSRRRRRAPWDNRRHTVLKRLAEAEQNGGVAFITRHGYSPRHPYEWTRWRQPLSCADAMRDITDFFGRHDLNIAALHKGTIEFRLFQGTLDPDRAEAWIRFCMAFMETVKRRTKPIPRYRTRYKLFQAINLDKASRYRLGDDIVTQDFGEVTMNPEWEASYRPPRDVQDRAHDIRDAMENEIRVEGGEWKNMQLVHAIGHW
jgi:hypothetical protein